MMRPAYIISASVISPQHTFDTGRFLDPVLSSDNNRLQVAEPDYRQFISPVAIRRMSRLLKMGISAGIKSLQSANIELPDAIITGTSRGSVTDTEHFLKDMLATDEGALNPTYFIQSTYNSVNGWLAMQTKCTGYNQTYVHRGFSFELALLDVQMMLDEAARPTYILAGGFDELTDDFFIIKSKRDYWKKELIDSRALLRHKDSAGTIAGEGAAFFTFSNEPGNAYCAVHAIQMLQSPAGNEVETAIKKMLWANNLKPEDIDVMLCGMNGDSSNNMQLFEHVIIKTAVTTTIAAYKHLCGEYETASGFALWLANYIFSENGLPEEIVYRKAVSKKIRNILIFNTTVLNNASLILIKSCRDQEATLPIT